MPETAVYKNYSPVFRQYNIRPSGIAFIVLAVSEALREKKLSHQTFRLGVGAPDVLHIAVSVFTHYCRIKKFNPAGYYLPQGSTYSLLLQILIKE